MQVIKTGRKYQIGMYAQHASQSKSETPCLMMCVLVNML